MAVHIVTTKDLAEMRRLVTQLERLGERLALGGFNSEAMAAEMCAFEVAKSADRVGYAIRSYENAVREIK